MAIIKTYKTFFTSVVTTTHYDARTRPINYGRMGLDALKTPSVAHVNFALSHFTHTSALASAFFDFRSLYMTTFVFSHFRTSAFYTFPHLPGYIVGKYSSKQ